MKKLGLARISTLLLGLAILLTAASPASAIGPWKGADASGNTIFVPMIHEGVEYVHVLNFPPAVVSPEWANDASLSEMDFALATVNPAKIDAIKRGADAIIPMDSDYLILHHGHTYVLHTQACHHWVGGVEHEHHLPETPATSPADCAAHAGTDPSMWHPDMLIMIVNVQ